MALQEDVAPGVGQSQQGGPGPVGCSLLEPQILGPQPKKVWATGWATQPPGASLHPGRWQGCTVSLSLSVTHTHTHTHTHTRARAFHCSECTPGLPEGRICPYLWWQLEVPEDSSLGSSLSSLPGPVVSPA